MRKNSYSVNATDITDLRIFLSEIGTVVAFCVDKVNPIVVAQVGKMQ